MYSSNKYSKVLTTILIVVIIAIVGLLAFFGFDYYRKYFITKEAGEALAEFDKQFGNVSQDNDDNTNNTVGYKHNSSYI